MSDTQRIDALFKLSREVAANYTKHAGSDDLCELEGEECLADFLYRALSAAPPDPRKDLAIPPFGWQLRAVDEALGKLRDAPLAKFLERGYHFNSQDDRNEAMGLGRDLANGIFDAIEQRLAEMRGAKR